MSEDVAAAEMERVLAAHQMVSTLTDACSCGAGDLDTLQPSGVAINQHRRHVALVLASARPGGGDGPCRTCGQHYPPWWAPHTLWNLVMGGPDATDDPGGLLCPNCFLRLADQRAPIRGAWMIAPDQGAKAEAWDEGHRTRQRRGPDDCQCFARSEGECGCGRYGTGPLLSLDANPYRADRRAER